ncbi:CRAL TRIO domain-containing protein [Butyriboletus roseoflavus]|nr:CRAL TRIO domain-containing protein [Butyriboletus roseoflavus]
MSSPVQTPLPVPSHPNVAPPRELTEEEQAEYESVLAHFANPDYVVPSVETEKGALMEVERMWLSYECILRYIRATKHDVSESIKRLEGTLKWRRDFGLYTFITPEHVEPEAVTGKEFVFGYDTRGRPALYMCPSRQNTEESPRQVQFVFWIFERVIELMGPGVETVALMIDYADKAKQPSFSTARQVLHVLQTHYPERLGAAIITHLPWLLHTFYKFITPFIDPLTRTKMIFNPVPDDAGLWRSAEERDQGQDDAKLFEPDQLVSDSWLGSAPFTYAHNIYWPALLSMTEARRNDMTRVWRDLGGVVGIKEWDVKVGVRAGFTAPPPEEAGQAL